MVVVRNIPLWLCLISTLLAKSSALDAANWMRDNIGLLGERQMKQICIPGSHNSGMYTLNGGTAFVKKCNVLNQSQPVLKQLQLGIRYLDMRPVISGGKFKAGHYTQVTNALWLGGNGQFIDSIVKDINDFITNSGELVIVYLSHGLNTDVGRKYRNFNKEEWNRLFQLLDETNNLFESSEYVYLPEYTLGQLTANGTKGAVLYVVGDEEASLGARKGKGFFYWGTLRVFDQYSGSNKYPTMFRDQISKMKLESEDNYFLLSWILTQNAIDATTCPLGRSIRKLAKEANSNIQKLLPEVSKTAFPNIIFVDFVESSEVTEVAIAINNKIVF
ncbi:unnamed protein product [Nezara viridula]|uniref:Uncharacterized protein n=1 Tax=Nezara viridula TaxID=85310 RepID=A0A9P0ECA5_NEZVI|nr:unnamed protein product [Nezara viridula]